MHYYMKRYIYGLSRRRLWLLLIILPPLAYLVSSSIRSDRFTVKQNISISKNTPVALESSPAGFRPMGEIVSHPDDFFMNNFAIRRLYTNLYAGTAVYRADRQFRFLVDTIKNDLSITMTAEDTLRIAYYGKNQNFGQELVTYYSKRLLRKAAEGLARSKLGDDKSKVPFSMDGMEVEEHRALWRPERLLPFVLISIVSLMGVLVLLGLLEWSDTSFKSERQVARYLGLPILGSMPDLNKISAALGAQTFELSE